MTEPVHKKDLPFPRRWKGYVALKVIILVLAIAVAFHLAGLV
ncbi:MAG: hypothetical protein AAGF14_09530 [Pseudomonadota bacterium]